MDATLLIQITVNLLAIGLGFYLIYYKAYMGQKGKNLATKEDIGVITKEIEQVKQEYTKGVELFKSQTDLIASNNKEHYKDSKKVIMDFYDSYVLWWHHTTNDSPKSMAPPETKFGSWMEDNYELEKDIIIHQKRFELFIENEELKNGAVKLVEATKNIFINILAKDLVFDEKRSEAYKYVEECKESGKEPDNDTLEELKVKRNKKILAFNVMVDNQKSGVLLHFDDFNASLRDYFDEMNHPVMEEKI